MDDLYWMDSHIDNDERITEEGDFDESETVTEMNHPSLSDHERNDFFRDPPFTV